MTWSLSRLPTLRVVLGPAKTGFSRAINKPWPSSWYTAARKDPGMVGWIRTTFRLPALDLHANGRHILFPRPLPWKRYPPQKTQFRHRSIGFQSRTGFYQRASRKMARLSISAHPATGESPRCYQALCIRRSCAW
ncbi:hypothetical protein V2G26_016498 [Clonostachys chloroleuca]